MIKQYFRGICLLVCMSCSLLFAKESSYSLSDCRGIPLDQKLVTLLNYRNGIFVEVGANDGLRQSNTKRLEEYYGWTGILVEPSPAAFSQLWLNRPNSDCFQCALGSFAQHDTYVIGDFDGHLMASVNGERLDRNPDQKVLVVCLQSILDEVGIKHVDFFSLDTEGCELNILRGIDFSRTTFEYLLIEIYSHQYQEIVSFLSNKGYAMIENFSNYNPKDNPAWDGSHNDYLFKRVK
jgi:FkbM family methyltransferase